MIKKLHKKFQNLITYLIFDLHWDWLHIIISTLCDLEMQLKVITDKEFVNHYINKADIKRVSPIKDDKYPHEEIIPMNTFYCDCCEYQAMSLIAYFFFGSQCCGYCYYLNNGDYRWLRPTELLWDGCKECGKFDEIEIENV